jgi:hypothetical protein
MYLVISRLKFNHSPDSYAVEAQSKDFGKLCEMLKALQLLNTEKDKTFHPLHMDGRTADQLK